MQIFEKITKGDFQFLKSKFVCIFICNFAKNVQKNEWLFLNRGILFLKKDNFEVEPPVLLMNRTTTTKYNLVVTKGCFSLV